MKPRTKSSGNPFIFPAISLEEGESCALDTVATSYAGRLVAWSASHSSTDSAFVHRKGVSMSVLGSDGEFDWNKFCTEKALQEVGLDRLKQELKSRGMKCGGTLSERAQRLLLVRGLAPEQYPPHVLAKQNRKRPRKRQKRINHQLIP